MNILYKRTSTGKVQQWEMQVRGNQYRTVSGQVGGQLVTHEWTTCHGKNVGRSNETTPEAQALLEAKAGWEKKIKEGYFEKVEDIDGSSLIKPMLALNWKDYKGEVEYPVYVQPKLDGMRMNVTATKAVSRKGETVRSVPHILEELKPLFERSPDLILDGEIYNHDLSQDFQYLMHLARQSSPGPQELADSAKYLQYWVYDYVDDTGLSFSQRASDLIVITPGLRTVQFVETQRADSEEDVELCRETFVKEGYEGIIIRQNKPYEHKRSKNLLKYKIFEDGEFEILEILEGEGGRSGMAGAITVRLPNGKTCNSGIRGGNLYYKYLWEHRYEFVGKLATVRYFGMTGEGKLRFPVVVDIDRPD